MTFIIQLKEDLKKLARLASSLTEAHTCAILLPTEVFEAASNTAASRHISPDLSPSLASSHPGPSVTHAEPSVSRSIELVAVHSISPSLSRDCRIQVGTGLLGWVAQHSRPIHVAPFDLDSGTLGLYSDLEPLKSLVAVPIPMPTETADGRGGGPGPTGVLMCDSRKAYSFSKPQIKVLEDIALQVSRLLFWAIFKREATSVESSWESFRLKLHQLGDAIGAESAEILRVSVETFSQVEQQHGLSAAVHQSEQFVRLAQQALPPHFPLARLPNGDILIALDNMMSSFFQHKLRTLANHVSTESRPFSIAVLSYPTRPLRGHSIDLDLVLQQRPVAVKSSSKSLPAKVIGGNSRA